MNQAIGTYRASADYSRGIRTVGSKVLRGVGAVAGVDAGPQEITLTCSASSHARLFKTIGSTTVP
jgi:hypothetical protein